MTMYLFLSVYMSIRNPAAETSSKWKANCCCAKFGQRKCGRNNARSPKISSPFHLIRRGMVEEFLARPSAPIRYAVRSLAAGVVKRIYSATHRGAKHISSREKSRASSRHSYSKTNRRDCGIS